MAAGVNKTGVAGIDCPYKAHHFPLLKDSLEPMFVMDTISSRKSLVRPRSGLITRFSSNNCNFKKLNGIMNAIIAFMIIDIKIMPLFDIKIKIV